jgi:hypothetical protein
LRLIEASFLYATGKFYNAFDIGYFHSSANEGCSLPIIHDILDRQMTNLSLLADLHMGLLSERFIAITVSDVGDEVWRAFCFQNFLVVLSSILNAKSIGM